MNPRVATTATGLIMLIFGAGAVVYPERVMGLLGFAALNPAHAAAALGEVRATYGGIFVVMGVATLLAGMDPAAHRARILLVGALWLGACGGRVFGISVDGNPGVLGWLTAAFELLVGGTLVIAAQQAGSAQRPAEAAPTPDTPSASFASGPSSTAT